MECVYLKNPLIWRSVFKTSFCSINFKYKLFHLKEITSELKYINVFSLYNGNRNSLNKIYVLTIVRDVAI